MEDSILKLITIGYALGIGICGVMAYLGIKGSNEAIDYQNSKLRQHDEWRKNNERACLVPWNQVAMNKSHS
jgi:hypothetical protein